jgi:hypothetical protein
MITERCIQNIKQILADHQTERDRQLLTQDDIETWFRKNKDKTIQISTINNNPLKLKTMLWNLDNLKSPIRSKFEVQLLNLLPTEGMVISNTDERVSEKPTQQPINVEKEPVYAIKEHSVEEINAEKSKKPIHSTYKKKEDWFDRMLDIVDAVVRGFMFHSA